MNINQLESFNLADAVKFHNKLNPKIWDKSEHIHPEIRDQLLTIAEDFANFLGVKNLDIKDITVSGSNAAYSYTPHSDIDLHLIVDFPADEHKDIYRELFDAKKAIYNKEHDIKIKGIPVELYVEAVDQGVHSQGIYSLINKDWIQIPRRVKADIDDISVKSKYKDLSRRIREALKSRSIDEMTKVADKIKNMRTTGLAEHGEFGAENLTFKLLRNKGDLEKLYKARAAAKNRELSLKERERMPVKYGFGADYIEEVGITPDGTNPTTCQFTNEEEPVAKNDKEIIDDFVKFCIEQLGIDKKINLRLRRDPAWSERNKTFGRYNNTTNELEVAVGYRHIMDVLRTLAHELVHQRQHETMTMPDNAGEDGSEWENQANATAGVLMRRYGKTHPELFVAGTLHESSGYIPTAAEADDPRYKMALTVDVRPGAIGKAANAFLLDTDSQGHPQFLRPDGVVHRMMEEYEKYKGKVK